MKRFILATGICSLIIGVQVVAAAVAVTPQEMSEAHNWVAARLGTTTADKAPTPPFSFVYGGRPSADFLKDWKFERSSKALDAERTEHTLTWTDSTTGLSARCRAVEYRDFPSVEWTLYLKNTGSADSPILENIQALDMRIVRGGQGEFLLHHNVGSPAVPNDYQPLQTVLGPNGTNRFGGAAGKSTGTDLSYFNVEWPGQGMIVVVGWPGQWAAQFSRDTTNGLAIRAGQELTHFKLLAGEEVRTPLIVLQFWKGDWIRAQNIWRRWMLAYNVPRPGGKLPEPELFGCSAHFTAEMSQATTENQIQWINRYLEEGIKIGHWWMDAGWYFNYGGGWPRTGTWEVDTNRFPAGLRAISDYAHSKGIKTIVWFEPERVAAGTWLTEKHPEWILGGKDGGLLNQGNPEARQWLTDHVDKLMTTEGIDLYREDFNMSPLSYWRANDAPDRQGITEIRHIEGHLAYWDELLRRHPNMFIDSCASGGQRNDLETMRRAIPLWRTDYRCEPVGTQCHTFGLSLWIPFSGTGAADVNSYVFRSNMTPFGNCLWDIRHPDTNTFRLYTVANAVGASAHDGLESWNPGSMDPALWHNPSKESVSCCGGIMWPPNGVIFDPAGAPSVGARWTAPSAGTYTITAAFTDAQAASERVYVYQGSALLYQNQTGTPTGSTVTYSDQITISAAGESLDFVSSGGRCTAVEITVSNAANGLAWNLGADFSVTNGNPNKLSGPRAGSSWSYGEYNYQSGQQLDYDLMRRLTGEFTQIAPNWLGDYYPLTPYSTGSDAWMAWQFDVPEKGEGMLQAFRRADSSFYGLQLKLQGLDPAATYALTDLDVHHKSKVYSGRTLMEQGLSVEIPDQPGAVVITYKKQGR